MHPHPAQIPWEVLVFGALVLLVTAAAGILVRRTMLSRLEGVLVVDAGAPHDQGEVKDDE